MLLRTVTDRPGLSEAGCSFDFVAPVALSMALDGLALRQRTVRERSCGLEKAGNSEYRVYANSGAAVLGAAGAAGFGDISPGSLEMSKVDLSQEFTPT